MHEILVKVPPFNHLCADKAGKKTARHIFPRPLTSLPTSAAYVK